MKISRRKALLMIALSTISIIGLSNVLFSQTNVAPKMTKFLILVETTDSGIRLTSKEGCAWKQLSFTIKLDSIQAIDQFGMTSLKREKSTIDNTLANFLFNIKRTKDGVIFEGLEGTAWKILSFSCPKNICHNYINQIGMTDDKK
jgi:hypothetical protein